MLCSQAVGQYVKITIKTKSFETKAHIGGRFLGKALGDWVDCGFRRETPPDIHNDTTSFFGVEKYAAVGSHYMGLVTRDNETWESVTQKLGKQVIKDRTYILGIFAARSDKFKSNSRIHTCLLYTSPSPRDATLSRMPSSA